MNIRKWIMVAAIMGVLVVTAFAKNANKISDERTEFMKEQRAYFLENIKPKIDAQRNILEQSISVTDKEEIARLRKEIIKQMLVESEFMLEARASNTNGEAVNEGLMAELIAQRIVINNLHDQAKIIANNYRPQIDDLMATVKDDGMDLMMAMNPPYNVMDRENNFQDRIAPIGQVTFPLMESGFSRGSQIDFGIVNFLLWDVN